MQTRKERSKKPFRHPVFWKQQASSGRSDFMGGRCGLYGDAANLIDIPSFEVPMPIEVYVQDLQSRLKPPLVDDGFDPIRHL